MVVSFSLSGRCANIERSSLLSFLSYGHEVQVFRYEEREDLPEGVLLRHAEEILSWEEMEVWQEFPEMLNYIFKYNFLLKEG